MKHAVTRVSAEAAAVYRPQEDSYLLVEALRQMGSMTRRRVLDLCTGSGVVALAAARMGADCVTAFDICPRAVQFARTRASVAGVDVHIRLGSWTQALECAPFDVVACNPPYVPTAPDPGGLTAPSWGGPSASWNGGQDGRMILDPLCGVAADMLNTGGVMFIVQSEFAGIERSLDQLRASGLKAYIVATQRIPFGPVLSAQASWLEKSGVLAPGRRDELLVVIRADKP